MSPTDERSPSAILRRMRRMILPDRVLGSAGANWTASGVAIRPKIVMEIGSREAVASSVGFVSSAEYIGDDRIRALPVIDAEIFNYAHIVRQDRLQSRMISAFLDVTRNLRSA